MKFRNNNKEFWTYTGKAKERELPSDRLDSLDSTDTRPRSSTSSLWYLLLNPCVGDSVSKYMQSSSSSYQQQQQQQ